MIKRNTIYLGLSLAFQAIAAFGINILLARTLSQADFGIYSFWISVITLLAIPLALGIPDLVNRELVFLMEQKRYESAKGLVMWSTRAISIFTIFVALGIWTIGELFLSSSTYWVGWVPVIVLITLPTLVVSAIRARIMAAFDKVVLGSIPDRLIRPFVLLSLLAFASFVVSKEITLTFAVTMQMVSVFVGTSVGWVYLRRSLPVSIRIAHPHYDWRLWIISALPLTITGSIQMLNKQADIIVLGVLTSPEEVAIFQIATRLALLAGFLHLAYSTAAATPIARHWKRFEHKDLQGLLARATTATTLITGAGIAVFVFYGPSLLIHVFGDNYTSAYGPTLVLLAGQLVNVAFGPSGLLLNMANHAKVTALIMLATAVLNIFLNFLLVPIWGMYGAATATTASYIFFNILLYRKCRSLLNIDPSCYSFLYLSKH